MFNKISYNVSGYLPKHLSRQVKELYLCVAIMDFAVAMIMIFEPIYLYTLGLSLQKILLFYLAVYVPYFFIIPLGAKFARRFGYEHSILLSTPLLIIYYLLLFGAATNLHFLFLAPLIYAIHKSFFWTGYHADFAHFSRDKERGRTVSNLRIIDSIVYIVGPFVGGLILEVAGFKTLFIVVAILILVSNVPLFTTREIFTPTQFSYKKAFARLFRQDNRKKFFSYLGFGEELIVLVIWPIFIYVVIKDYLSIGSLVAGATFLTTLLILYIGRITDKRNSHSVLKLGSFIYSLVWFLRLFIRGGWHVFFVDSLSRFSKNMIYVPQMAITYRRAARTSVMKSVLFFEMSLIVGKILAMVLVFFLIFIFPPGFKAAFVLAGLMALLYALL